MTAPRQYRPVLPSRAPSASDLAERDRFAELGRDSLRSVRASAEVWRNGLIAFITLVTTGVIIQGRTAVGALPFEWRLATTVLIASGLAAAVAGLWQALVAQAGIPVVVTLAEVHARFGSLLAFETAIAVRDARRLDRARYWVGASLVLLFAGVGATWWAPEAPLTPPAYLWVSRGSDALCGTLRAADGGVLRLSVAGRHDEVVVPLAEISNLRVVAACPPQ